VRASLDYLLEARERDPFQALAPRLAYERLSGRPAPSFTIRNDD